VSVTVDNAGFAPSLEEAPDSLVVLFAREGSLDRDARAALSTAVEAANDAAERWGAGDPDVQGNQPAATPHGPVVFVESWESDTVRPWLDIVAEHLGHQGWSGRLTPIKPEYPPMYRTRTPHEIWGYAAVLFLAGWRSKEGRQNNVRAIPPWRADPKLSAELAKWAVDWAALIEGDLYLDHRMTSFRVEQDFALQTLADALVMDVPHPSVTGCEGTDVVRRVSFDSLGRLIVTTRNVGDAWHAQVTNLLDVVQHHAHRCEMALVRQALVKADLINVINFLPPTLPNKRSDRSPAFYYDTRRDFDGSTVPDACGVLLLTDAHLARARDLTRWRMSQPAPGKTLLEARDLAVWFAQPEIEPKVSTGARADLGDMILWEYPAEPR